MWVSAHFVCVCVCMCICSCDGHGNTSIGLSYGSTAEFECVVQTEKS